ncbi:MAG: hypothetical protein PHT75_01240 [Bacilli bacterium]|nr:hypothetical protein [Bacilli bacterium]MDD3304740.1 hypothetical protein [Bacilli bacterium]MDD4053581.1 hypothetical protein [Bacilli bacterium]MDD4411080.1 hypothetical protein [Bacilli bacterium]
MGKDKYGYKHDDGHYSKMTGKDDKVSYSIYDKNPSDSDHKSTHINYDTESGKGSIVDTTSGEKETTDITCFLTTACMKHFKDTFDDNCQELTILRWFRDNFVSQEDIAHYYQTAPVIVLAIDDNPNSEAIYDYIYENVINVCVEAIKNGDYKFAYNRYKNSILSFEETFARKELQNRLVKTLKKSNTSIRA